MKLQVDIPKELNKEIKKYKIDFDLINLQEVVIKILTEKFLKHRDYRDFIK